MNGRMNGGDRSVVGFSESPLDSYLGKMTNYHLREGWKHNSSVNISGFGVPN